MSRAILTWRGGEIARRTRAAEEQGMFLAAEHLRAESQKQVPHAEGTLENTAAITVLEGGSTVAVSYNTPYARRQHEELGYRHPHGRKAKYLEDPARDEERAMRRIFAETVRRATK